MGGKPRAAELLRFGGLPLVPAKALVRSRETFTRFLEVAALADAQVTNVASLAWDAG